MEEDQENMIRGNIEFIITQSLNDEVNTDKEISHHSKKSWKKELRGNKFHGKYIVDILRKEELSRACANQIRSDRGQKFQMASCKKCRTLKRWTNFMRPHEKLKRMYTSKANGPSLHLLLDFIHIIDLGGFEQGISVLQYTC